MKNVQVKLRLVDTLYCHTILLSIKKNVKVLHFLQKWNVVFTFFKKCK